MHVLVYWTIERTRKTQFALNSVNKVGKDLFASNERPCLVPAISPTSGNCLRQSRSPRRWYIPTKWRDTLHKHECHGVIALVIGRSPQLKKELIYSNNCSSCHMQEFTEFAASRVKPRWVSVLVTLLLVQVAPVCSKVGPGLMFFLLSPTNPAGKTEDNTAVQTPLLGVAIMWPTFQKTVTLSTKSTDKITSAICERMLYHTDYICSACCCWIHFGIPPSCIIKVQCSTNVLTRNVRTQSKCRFALWLNLPLNLSSHHKLGRDRGNVANVVATLRNSSIPRGEPKEAKDKAHLTQPRVKHIHAHKPCIIVWPLRRCC